MACPDDSRLPFASSEFLTLGVEVEVQLLDWKTLEPCPAAPRILRRLGPAEQALKPEIFQSMLELSTGVCRGLYEVEQDLLRGHRLLLAEADRLGLEVVGVGTHPHDGAHKEALLMPSDRYRMLFERNKWISTAMAIYGLHVHVGVRSGDHAIELIQAVSPYLGHLLALSASSPFSAGKDTGLASSRITVFESKPTTGTPPAFQSWQEFEQLVACMMRSGSITHLKDLWWDIRPSPGFGTVEVRICDGQSNLADTLALTAAVQLLFAWAEARRLDGEPLPPASPWRLRENKWRAARWGLEARVLIDDHGNTRCLQEEWQDLLREFRPLAEKLGSLPHLEHLHRMVAEGGSAARQRRIYAETGSLASVVQWLAQDWRSAGLVPAVSAPLQVRSRLSA